MAMVGNLKVRRLRSFTALLVLLFLIPSFGVLVSEAPALAGGGYPDDGAICMSTSVRNGACGGYNWGYKVNGVWQLNSSRGFGYRNCTDFVAYRTGLTWSSFGFSGGQGNAIDWKAHAGNVGRQVASSASVGDIAWWGSSVSAYGHVALVTAVASDGSVTIEEYNHDTLGNWDSRSGVRAEAYLHAGGASPPPSSTPGLLHTAVALIPNDGASGYVVDGYGGLHPVGNATPVSNGPYWNGWDIARGIAVIGNGSGYVLDGYGGVHSFGNAPGIGNEAYWGGWDIARGIALCPSPIGGVESGYTLDGYGGVHSFGNAPGIGNEAYWGGWDIARSIAVNSTCTGGYTLDGYGGVHSFGNAPGIGNEAYWGGWDIARSITLVSDSSGYTLDGYGGIHPFSAAGSPAPKAPSGLGYDSASDNPFDAIAFDPASNTGMQVSNVTTNGTFNQYAFAG